jgi:glutamine synthetase
MPLNEAKEYLEKNQIHTVEIGFGDVNGVLRGKRIPVRHFLKIAETGSALAKAAFAWDIQCGVFPGLELASFDNGYPDMIARPILSTLRKIPWREGSAFVLADIYDEHGHIVEVTPRRVLSNVIKKANDLGYRPLVGSELEFYLLDQERRPLFNGIQCYSLYKGATLEYVLEEIRTGLEDYGIPLEALHIEYGPAQIEIIPEYDDALTMADNTLIIKNAVREIAYKHGVYASFMAKPWEGESGCGYHVHQSLWDPERKENLFGKDETLARHYLAGLLTTARELMVLGSPSINSYKRFTDYSFAPVNVTWDYDNRTVATRSLLGLEKESRIEHRTGSADANPYTIIAANIAAGLHGLEHQLEPPEQIRADAYTVDATPLPTNLGHALDLLEASTVAKQYLGENFVKMFLTIGRHEVSLFEKAVTDWERERYWEMS